MNGCTEWKSVMGINMLTLILYIVYIAVYPRRFTMIGFVTTMMMMGWLLVKK